MAAITSSDIPASRTEVHVESASKKYSSKLMIVRPFSALGDTIKIVQYDESFGQRIGDSPCHSLLLSSADTQTPFFHEACVFLPDHDEIYTTSNLLQSVSSARYPTILISRIKLHRTDKLSEEKDIHTVVWAKLRSPPGIDMPNGGVNYKDGIIFCAQGSVKPGTGGIYYMPHNKPPIPLVTNFHGRDFNSVNDVVVAKDGCIWFTDPSYGSEQDFRPKPKLPNQVYRYNPETGDLRVMADGFGMPNGLCFSPDEDFLYITDTDAVHGNGYATKQNLTRPAAIYAFRVANIHNAPFLVDRRVFAFAAEGIPDGIKCDVEGNVYAGCGDGIEVWSPNGSLIGKILVPGGCANFCFGKDGELFICAETKFWRLQLAKSTKGALLGI
ncbi:D-lactonohydrolase-like protein-like protein [Bisporella sp. PMI_857]|nr:D-lactonohydrolase-like protein-like protein [Bisporella sp. PMI_857]